MFTTHSDIFKKGDPTTKDGWYAKTGWKCIFDCANPVFLICYGPQCQGVYAWGHQNLEKHLKTKAHKKLWYDFDSQWKARCKSEQSSQPMAKRQRISAPDPQRTMRTQLSTIGHQLHPTLSKADLAVIQNHGYMPPQNQKLLYLQSKGVSTSCLTPSDVEQMYALLKKTDRPPVKAPMLTGNVHSAHPHQSVLSQEVKYNLFVYARFYCLTCIRLYMCTFVYVLRCFPSHTFSTRKTNSWSRLNWIFLRM